MRMLGETRKITREEYIKQFNDLFDEYGREYHHFAITGHFGGCGKGYSKEEQHNSLLLFGSSCPEIYQTLEQYRESWLKEERQFRRFFGILSRKYTGIRKWGKSSRHREMKVLIVPEIQQRLHLHGIIFLPMEMNEFEIEVFNHFAKVEWKKIYKKGSFLITKKGPIIRDDRVYTWEEYITKMIGYGDIAEHTSHLPFKK